MVGTKAKEPEPKWTTIYLHVCSCDLNGPAIFNYVVASRVARTLSISVQALFDSAVASRQNSSRIQLAQFAQRDVAEQKLAQISGFGLFIIGPCYELIAEQEQ